MGKVLPYPDLFHHATCGTIWVLGRFARVCVGRAAIGLTAYRARVHGVGVPTREGGGPAREYIGGSVGKAPGRDGGRARNLGVAAVKSKQPN